ncbi:hypothetical protein OCU04_000955 [Sclerotinia nivalis]|uniref:ABC-2 type transporter transmembrane domain-containing protein n=1 Tax=Sclerotinia nivalis TaxID=352851 RepID=A0A9X0AX69_9HELO|nr:hypothetical protein OCU04_000955 [Sclerotinia nivalis]
MHWDFKGESIYLAELDKHFPELSVGKTLSFAASTRETGKNSNAVSQATGREVAVLFGLSNAFDTKMGNDLIRGVSGGETRRTSIAEALVSRVQFHCWDNSTRGLDSSIVQQFITLLKRSTKALQSTVVMSIYQGSNAMYHGRQIYFGPVDSATDYFHKLGFAKDNRATTPDFLTSLTSQAERTVRQGFEGQTPRSPEEFAAAWKQSAERKRLIADVNVFNSSHPLKMSNRAGTDSSTNSNSMKEMLDICSATYPIPISQQVLICLQRGLLLLRNNYIPAVSTVFANAILAIVVGSVFYDLPDTSVSMDQKAVLIFFSLMIAFSPAFEVSCLGALKFLSLVGVVTDSLSNSLGPNLVGTKTYCGKARSIRFLSYFCEAVAAILCDLPVKVGTTVMFYLTLYFMKSLRRTASAFFTLRRLHVLYRSNYEHGFQNLGLPVKNNGTDYGPRTCHSFTVYRVHWFCNTSTVYEALAFLV